MRQEQFLCESPSKDLRVIYGFVDAANNGTIWHPLTEPGTVFKRGVVGHRTALKS